MIEAMEKAAMHLQMKGMGMKHFLKVAVPEEDKKKFKIRKSDPTFRWYYEGKAKHPYKQGDTFQDIVVFVME